MWERRYEAVVAERTPNGRRSYRPEDVEKLSLLKSLTDLGTGIGSIAHLSLAELRQRASQMDRIRAMPVVGELRVAALGITLPDLLEGPRTANEHFTLVARGTDPRQFRADVRQQRPDALLIEISTLDAESVRLVTDLSRASRAEHVVVIYDFARSKDEQDLRSRGLRLLRSPVTTDELVMAVIAAVHGSVRGAAPTEKPSETPVQTDHEAIPPRRFTDQQLQRLRATPTAVDCECPRHISDVIHTLSAFETYSQQCEDRNAEDAALHAFLRLSSARARNMMEEAMEKLLEVENIEL